MMSLSRAARLLEVSKCDLLCANCHAETEQQERGLASHAWSLRRREVWRQLVEEHGGRCIRCSYDISDHALQFHHRDPSTKTMNVSELIVKSRFKEARLETSLCDLVCANCHSEIEEELQYARLDSNQRPPAPQAGATIH